MGGNYLIRLYQPGDRAAVRRICCETADLGRPVEGFFDDREVFADALTLYYTDYEPASLWVALAQGEVAGYLMGCLDTRRYLRLMALKIIPRLILRAFCRGVFFRRPAWHLFSGALKSARCGSLKRQMDLNKYPAHLHIDISEKFRGQGMGRRLIEEFFLYLKGKGISGVHLSTRADSPACAFFEGMGFKALGRYPVFFPKRDGFVFGQSVVYAKLL